MGGEVALGTGFDPLGKDLHDFKGTTATNEGEKAIIRVREGLVSHLGLNLFHHHQFARRCLSIFERNAILHICVFHFIHEFLHIREIPKKNEPVPCREF